MIDLDDCSLNWDCYLIVIKDKKSLKWKWFWFKRLKQLTVMMSWKLSFFKKHTSK